MAILVPAGLSSGDEYYLVFVTEGKRDALSKDILDYDKFVKSESEKPGAVTAGWGVAWRVIGSTPSTNALDHLAFTAAPVYRLDSTLVREQAQAIWIGGSLKNPISITQYARPAGPDLVYTGTGYNGDYAAPGAKLAALGAEFITMLGDPAVSGSEWVEKTFIQDRGQPHPLYAVSPLLMAP